MVSVTPDITTSTSFQAPPPRAKADPGPANDSFASLVDSNTTAAANNSDRAQDRVQDRARDASPPPRQANSDNRPAPARRDETDAADKGQSRNAKADKAERRDTDDRDVAAADQSGADKPAQTGSKDRTKTKSAAGEGDESKPADKPSSDETDATTSTDTQAASDQASTGTTDAVAAIISLAVVATDVQAPAAPSAAATPAGDAAGPLTIAVPAIAASNAVSEAATTPAAAAADAAGKAAATGLKAGTQAKTGEATSGQGAQAVDDAAAPAIALTLPTAKPAAPKTSAAKSSTAAGDAAASSDKTDTSTTSTDAPAVNTTAQTATPGTEQPAAAKQTVKNAHAAPAEAEAGTDPSAGLAHLNSAHPDAAPGQSNAPANTAQATASFQPLLQTTATQAQSSFTVTAATPSAAVPLSGLAMEIAASVKSGKSRFEIRLDPAELGRIDVRIDVDRSGQVTSHLTVEKPETLSMLRQDAPQLQRALNDAGLSTGDSGLQFSLRDQSSSGQQNGNQSNPNAQRLIITEEETVPAVMANNYGRLLGASGGLDIRV